MRLHPGFGLVCAQRPCALMDWASFMGGFLIGLLAGGAIGVLAVGLGLAAKSDWPYQR